MNADPQFNLAASAVHAVGNAQDCFRRNGGNLSGILLIAGGDRAFDLFCDTRVLLEELDPDAREVLLALAEMKIIIEDGRDPAFVSRTHCAGTARASPKSSLGSIDRRRSRARTGINQQTPCRRNIMTLKVNLSEVRISQDLETRRLKAHYAAALLRTTPVLSPGCEGEATEFYVATLIALIGAWSGMSNHERVELLATARSSETMHSDAERPLLGDYHVA